MKESIKIFVIGVNDDRDGGEVFFVSQHFLVCIEKCY